MKRPVLILVGPTAVGKTAVSIDLARRLDAEIMSADSRQVYEYMDIGTAKPTPQQLAAVPHHFIDIKKPDETYSAGRFGREARARIAEIMRRDKQAMVVGGSGLYIRGLVDGFFEPQVADETVKQRLQRETSENGVETMHERLQQIDPPTAERLPQTDTQRILRALEVYELTGKPFSEFLQMQPEAADFETVFVGLTRERSELYARIETRVDDMLLQGLLDEVRDLQRRGYGPDLNALQTVGYQEAFQHLNGEISYEEMVHLIKQKTRNYAKRQMTWFRKEERIRWIEVGSFCETVELVENIYDLYVEGMRQPY